MGNVAEYLQNPSFASARIRPLKNSADIESSFYSLMIAVLTGLKAPKLMNDFTHLLLEDEHLNATTKVFTKFQESLSQLSNVIDERNKNRKYKYYGFHPKRLLSSVSI